MLDKPSSVTKRIHQELADRAGRSSEDAYAMPAEFYTSVDFLKEEIEILLRRDWMCVGHVGEVRNPGDFFTTEMLDEQLLVVRDTDNVVRVMSNVCRHRGNRVAEGSGNARKFICPYHTWTYDTTGELKVAPMMKRQKSFDQSKCGLPVFRSEIWNGWIFVDLEGDALPLTSRLDGLQEIIKNYHQDSRHLVFMEEDIWNCNWKALFENFMEGYHLSATHPTTLHPITPTKLCKKMTSGPDWTGYHAYYDPSFPPRGPFHPDLTEEERNNSPMFGIYPNLLVGMATNFTLFMIVRPAGPDQTRIRWGVTGQEDDPDAEAVKAYVDLCRSFNTEDKEKLEALDAINSYIEEMEKMYQKAS